MIFIDYHENEVDEALHLEGKEEDVETSYDLKFGHEVEGEEIEEEEEDEDKFEEDFKESIRQNEE